jgi:hypothetical protein
MCMCACVHVCMCVRACVYSRMFVYVCVCVSVCIVFDCTYVYVCVLFHCTHPHMISLRRIYALIFTGRIPGRVCFFLSGKQQTPSSLHKHILLYEQASSQPSESLFLVNLVYVCVCVCACVHVCARPCEHARVCALVCVCALLPAQTLQWCAWQGSELC